MCPEIIPHSVRPYLSKEKIAKRIEQLSQNLAEEYVGIEDKTVLLCVLKGAFMFTADLVRCLPLNLPIEFCRAKSYGADMESSEKVELELPPESKIAGKYVIIVEDIVDTGLTIDRLMRELNYLRAKRIEVCALLTKPSRRKIQVPIRYIGFEVPDLFFVGYGLDYADLYRNLDHIGVVVPTSEAKLP